MIMGYKTKHRSVPLTRSLRSVLKANYMEYLTANPKPVIFRGIGTSRSNKILQIDPSKFTRVSANTDNYYTLLMDESKEWKKYPKRSKSIVCSTSLMNASDFGSAFIVIPSDGAKMGVCPSADLWNAFPAVRSSIKNVYDMSEFNNRLDNGFAYAARLRKQKYNIKEFSDLTKWIGYLEQIMRSDIASDMYGYRLSEDAESWIQKGGTLLSYFNYIMSPKLNSFQLASNTSIKRAPGVKGSREIWTDAKSLLVPYSYFDVDDPQYTYNQLRRSAGLMG